MSGREIFRKRKELLEFRTSRASGEVEDPFTAFKTTEVSVTSELLVPKPLSAFDPIRIGRAPSRGYVQYTTTIGSTPSCSQYEVPVLSRRRTGSVSTQFHKNRVALDANTAAWRYTKVALLFFISLLVTWVPSSINRIYDLAHPHHVSYALNYASAIVLPLMGFWNSVIYATTTRALCKTIFYETLEKLAFTKKAPINVPRNSAVMRESYFLRESGIEGSLNESLTHLTREEQYGRQQHAV
ncbi:MAG: hypothetical protein Q9190_003834 [Brigantiaea leucoxantha]